MLRLLFSIVMMLAGAVLVLIAGAGKIGALVNGLGLSLIVAGVVAAFRELVIVRFEAGETTDAIATKLHQRMFAERGSGVRLVSPVRRGYNGYYRWTTTNEPCALFFAGRSVLHRMRADFRDRTMYPVEEVLLAKLQQGSTIRILFLDPRSDLIPRLAHEEGQTEESMLSDLAVSLGICHRLYELINSEKSLPARAQLHIRVYDEVPHFAYHREDDDVVIGFYFLTLLGSASAAFEVIDTQTKQFFEEHFAGIFARAAGTGRILELSPHQTAPRFDAALYDELRNTLTKALGQQRCERLLAGHG